MLPKPPVFLTLRDGDILSLPWYVLPAWLPVTPESANSTTGYYYICLTSAADTLLSVNVHLLAVCDGHVIDLF